MSNRAEKPYLFYLLGSLLVVALAILVVQLTWSSSQEMPVLPMYDFVEYWAAARLTLEGDNPYDLVRVEHLQHQIGHSGAGILMWNPPWALPLVLPLGQLEVRTAHLVWIGLNFLVLGFCADRLWRLYGGSADYRWVAWLVALTFIPCYFALTAGQISPLVLLGATLFLHFNERRADALMGVAAVLLAIKPHLCYLFWIALFGWAIRERRWKLLAAGAATGAVLTAIPLVFDPQLLQQYWHAFTTQPPAQYRSPTLAHIIRVCLDPANFRLHFLAMIPGLLWFVPWWLCQPCPWDWKEQMPLLLLVSVLTTAYGGWPFDLVLLLVPVMDIATRLQGREQWRQQLVAATIHTALGLIALGQIAVGTEYFWFIWMCPTYLVAYVSLRWWIARPQVAAPVHA
jgi:hypothetical protein